MGRWPSPARVAASSGGTASTRSVRWSSNDRRAWVHGHHAGAWSPFQQLPHSTVPTFAAIWSANRVSSAVLPIQASPITSTSPAHPETAFLGGAATAW
jgi:hypothetical protein